MPPTKFQLIPTYGSGGDVENVKKLTTDNGQKAMAWADLEQSSRWAKDILRSSPGIFI